jgi:hypothetical protein
MHAVGNTSFVDDHEDVADGNLDLCRSCHGADLKGTVLSRVAVDRRIWNSEDDRWENYTKGEMVRCDTCHGMP